MISDKFRNINSIIFFIIFVRENYVSDVLSRSYGYNHTYTLQASAVLARAAITLKMKSGISICVRTELNCL